MISKEKIKVKKALEAEGKGDDAEGDGEATAKPAAKVSPTFNERTEVMR